MDLGPIRLRWGHLFCAAGAALLPLVGLLVVFATYTPITTSGLCYTLGAVAFTLGLLVAPLLPKTSWFLSIVGTLAIVATAGVRLSVGDDGSTVKLITLPAGTSTRWVDRLIHERDLSLFGQRAAALTGFALSPREADGLTEALTKAYAALAAVDGTTSSPCLATYLFMQRPDAFDTIVVEPRASVPPSSTPPPQAAVIYLHGFTGSFTVQAWLVGQAARELNMLTVAPATGFIGNWWTSNGEATIRRTITYLRGRGIQRIYLAGLSNGAVGVCRLAPKLQADLTGIILLSGADAFAPQSTLPVLALQGNHDERMPADLTARYVKQAGDRGTYREFDGDHLLLAKHAPEVQAELLKWLREREAQAK